MGFLSLPTKCKKVVLALGAESDGNFSVFCNGKIIFLDGFSDLLEEKNWKRYKTSILSYLKKNNLKPEIILTDLHPLFNTTLWGQTLAQKYKAKHIQIQHHIAHIFSAIGDKIIQNTKHRVPSAMYCVAMDGTGYGFDRKIWGGEIFKVKSNKFLTKTTRSRNIADKFESVKRIGHLENQIMIGGEMAIKEPARMLISILNKIFPYTKFNLGSDNKKTLKQVQHDKNKKNVYQFVKKYYTLNEFELLYNQLQRNFNCQETSSTGRILDAVSVLLGFCRNERIYKHEPIDFLERNSTIPYRDLKPILLESFPNYILQTTPLFKYLIKNLHKDKKRLAATAQLYIAEGLWKILTLYHFERSKKPGIYKEKSTHVDTFFAGGIANNKIISAYLESKNFYSNKKIPRGDAGISFGQIIYYFFN